MSRTKRPFFSLAAALREGLGAAAPYLLAHHEPSDYDRCYRVLGHAMCARCAGVYAGIAAGAALYAAALFPVLYAPAIALLPAPMLTEWVLEKKRVIQGSNPLRTLTGFLCGTAYALGLARFFSSFPDPFVLGVGGFYALAALAALALLKNPPAHAPAGGRPLKCAGTSSPARAPCKP